MNKFKQLSKIKNLLLDAKIVFKGIENQDLECKLDVAMYNFIKAYELEEAKLRSEGKNGNDILLMLRD